MNKEQATALLSEIQSVIGETFRVSGPWEVCSRDRETGERQGTGIFSIGIFTYPEDECIISIQKEEEWIAIKHLAFSVVRNLTRVVQ